MIALVQFFVLIRMVNAGVLSHPRAFNPCGIKYAPAPGPSA